MSAPQTAWTFPPALNTTFVHVYIEQWKDTHDGNNFNGSAMALALEAVQNLTLSQRSNHGYGNETWGGDLAVVSVGDTVEGDFESQGPRMLSMDCVLCRTGPSNDGRIEEACLNYTDSHQIQFYAREQGPTSSLYVDVPLLEQYSSLPNETCGICMFSLPPPPGTKQTADYSVPFLLQKQRVSERRIFNQTYPTGVIAPRSSPPVVLAPSSEPSVGKLRSETPRNSNLIVGVVVGVLAAASILMGIIIWLWTRRRDKKKPYDSAVSLRAPTPQSSSHATQSIPLQNIEPVVRRPDSSSGEVPPAYHEVVRPKQMNP